MNYQLILGQRGETTLGSMVNKFPKTRIIFQQHQVNVTTCLSQTIKEVANNHNIENRFGASRSLQIMERTL